MAKECAYRSRRRDSVVAKGDGRRNGDNASWVSNNHSARLGLFALFLGAFAVGTDGFMIAGLLPKIAGDFAISTPVAAQLITAFSVSYAVGAPVMATLSRRVDRRVVLVAGLTGLAVTNAAAALTQGLMVLFIARIAAALAAGAYAPAAAVVAAGLADPTQRGRALSVITGGLTLSIVTGVPLGNLVGDRWGWRATFCGVAMLSTILAISLRVLLPSIAADVAKTASPQRAAVLLQPGVRGVLTTTMLGILAGYLGYTYVAPISAAVGATGRGSLAVVLLCFGAGAALGSTLAGAGVDRYGQALVVQTGALIQALALALLATGAAVGLRIGLTPSAAAFALLGVGSWTYSAPQQHRLVELAPRNATTAVSLNSSAIYVGIGLSGALGACTSSGGPMTTCITGMALALVTALTAHRGRPRRRTKPDQ